MQMRNLLIAFLLSFLIVSCTTLNAPTAAAEGENGGEGPTRVAEARTDPAPEPEAEEPQPAADAPPEPDAAVEEPRGAESAPPAAANSESETAADSEPRVAAVKTEPAEAVSKPAAEPSPSLPDYRPGDPMESIGFLMLSPHIDTGAAAETADEESSGAADSRQTEAAAETDADDRTASRTASAGSESRGAAEGAQRSDTGAAEAGRRAAAAEAGDAETKAEPGVAAQEPKSAETGTELIRAGKGEQVHLSLPGFGWIYDRGSSQARGVEFLSRSYAQSATEFVFAAQEVGRYTLAFQQQNSSTGSSTLRRIAVEVSRNSIQERIAAEAARPAATGGEKGDAGDLLAAEDEERRRPPQMQLPNFSFERLENALRGRNANSTAQQVQALLISRNREPLADGVLADRQDQLQMMVDAGQLLFETEREALAEQVLKLFLEQAGEQSGGDYTGRALYLLGQIYESPPPPRDERQAVEFYRRIVSFYPTDPYRRRAEERIKYLQRHFLQIR